MTDRANGSPPPPPEGRAFSPLVTPSPLPQATGASVVRLADGSGVVLLQVHNAGGMAFAFLTPAEASAVAESLARNALEAELKLPPRGLHLPD